MQPIPGLREVAKQAGVSIGTASQALRNTGRTSRATCERVQRVAEKLGYRPDPLMASAASRRVRGLPGTGSKPPVVYLTGLCNQQADRVTLRFLRPIQARLDSLGYGFLHHNAATPGELRPLLRQWYYRGVRGIAIGLLEWQPDFASFDWSEFSVIMLGARMRYPVFHTLHGDASIGFQKTLEMAMAHGGKIGIVLHQHDPPIHDDLLRAGLARRIRRACIHTARFQESFSVGSEKIGSWFSRHRPDVVVGFQLARSELEQANWRAGRDYAFFCPSLDEPDPMVSGCLEPNEEVGRRGAEWLDAMIRHGERGIPSPPVLLSVPPG